MSKLPKLKLKSTLGYQLGEFRDFEQAKHSLFDWAKTFVVVEGQVIYSYEELVQVAAQDCYKDKEYLEVVLVRAIGGG
jgi:hypothetical protein